jgi:hypothetical protein
MPSPPILQLFRPHTRCPIYAMGRNDAGIGSVGLCDGQAMTLTRCSRRIASGLDVLEPDEIA